ncbi:polysaccharide lyase family 1 protein [Micromonospora sp. LOL_025]|uniref:pectate lyase family protein n=1 Tax=Micromonospora sp. LOL_025 TaxID=3345413 RepID=UPI003A87AC10
MLATRNPDGPPRPGRRRRLLAAAGLAAALVAPASPAGAAPQPAPPAPPAPQAASGTASETAPGTAPATAGTALRTASGTAPAAAADGFASVSALGQNGTTGGAGGPVVTVTTTAQFLDHIARPGPYVIQVAGTITLPTGANDGMWNVASDKTIVGLGDDATLSGGGLNIGVPVDDDVTSPPANAVHNIIIRNLHLTGATDDLINIQMFSHHIWIDHNEFSNGDDGAVDIKRGSDFVTVSWNHFHDHDKTLLLGHDEDAGPQDIGRLRVTYHHNFFDRSDQRNPRVRFSALAHVYNNHYNDNSYGVASTYDAAVLMENNYFYSVNNPGRVDFSGDLGRIVERGNILIACNHPIETRGTVPDPRGYYPYTLDPAASVPTIVPAGAGPGRTTALAAPAAAGPDGFAAVAALGQNGTTGGAGGPTVTATNAADLLEHIDTVGPLVIQVTGRIAITSKQGVRPNKTIVGVGNAEITGGGLDFYRSYNVIVRNINFTNAEDDAINVGQNSHHIWIDHNRFSGAVDGSVDIVRGADYVTVSWNHFDHADKSMLIGHSDGSASTDVGRLKVSIHHNFFDNSRQRHPRVRFGEPVHVYNNYFLGNALYGVASTENAGVLVEGNYFRDVPHPLWSASGYADSGPGRAVQRHNVYVGSGTPETNGTVVEPRTYYPYTLDPAADVPALVVAGAGTGRI